MNVESLPLVSICTPTFNRRQFIPLIIKCVEHQDYPKDKIEWIIVDDGSDKIFDLVCDLKFVKIKYVRLERKTPLGKKRNICHRYCVGKIIINMDDDDYYPEERISHAVCTLYNTPNALCAGSSIMFTYFSHINKIYKFGPYGKNHSTAATFAFKRELLLQTAYDDNSCIAEEKYFLKNYTIPFVQLNSIKTILVFSHPYNSFDKKVLLEPRNKNSFVTETELTLEMFIPNPEFKKLYIPILSP